MTRFEEKKTISTPTLSGFDFVRKSYFDYMYEPYCHYLSFTRL